jgi:hypothetical protein
MARDHVDDAFYSIEIELTTLIRWEIPVPHVVPECLISNRESRISVRF